MEGVEVPVIEGELVRLWVLQWRKEGQRKAGSISRLVFGRAAPCPQVGLVCERDRARAGKPYSGPFKMERQEST